MKIEKNYFRNNIKELITNTNGKPVIITGKYKHSSTNKWATFTTVRSYIPGVKSYILCNHINILKCDVDKYIKLNEEVNNRKFYIIGYPNIYTHYDIKRGCIFLAKDIGIAPIFLAENIDNINNQILDKCYKFPVEKYKRVTGKELND